MPGIRPPTTLIPTGASVSYTSSQVRAGPTSTVPSSALTFVLLKRNNAICTPDVDENPGLLVCPPPFTAKGVLHDPRIFSYAKKRGQLALRSLKPVDIRSCSRPRLNLAPLSKWTPQRSNKQSVKCRPYTEDRLGWAISFRGPQVRGYELPTWEKYL